MSVLLQDILVLALVIAAVLIVSRQAMRTLNLRGGKMGSCCSKGCDANEASKPSAEKIHFLPAEMLGRRK